MALCACWLYYTFTAWALPPSKSHPSFLFYEFFGVVTNAVGGWLGARIGLNRTMQIGLLMQIGALSMLLVPDKMLTVIWVMVAQALSGIAKDLNKMSAKSSMKSIASDQNDGLYRIVAF